MHPARVPLVPLALLALLAAAPAGSAAISSKLEPPDLSRYVRWGPLRVRPGIQLKDVGYDDNIFLDPARRESDVRFTVAPGLDGLVLFGDRSFLTFREQLDANVFVNHPDFNALDQRGTARLTVPIQDFGVFADVTLNRVHERPVDVEDIRPRRRDERLLAGVILKPGWRTEIELGAQWQEWSYSDPDDAAFGSGQSIGERLDRAERGLSLAAAYSLKGRTALLLDVERTRIDFDHDFLLAGAPATRDSEAWEISPGVALGRGGPLQGTLRAGFKRIDADETALPDFSDFVADLELDWRASSLLQFDLDAERSAGFAIFGVDNYFLTTSGGLRVTRFLNRLVGLEAGVGAGRLSFPGAAGAASREDRTFQYDGGLRLRLAESSIGRRVDYRLRVGRWRRSSSNSIFDNSRTIVALDATVGF